MIELVPILRSYSEEGWSNPKKILDRILENIAENQSGQISYETLLNWVMDYFYEEGILKSSKVEAANMWATLILICEERIDAKISDVVDDIEKRCAQIADYFSTENNLNCKSVSLCRSIQGMQPEVSGFHGGHCTCQIGIERNRKRLFRQNHQWKESGRF